MTARKVFQILHLGRSRRSLADLKAWAKRAQRPLYVIRQWDTQDRTCAGCDRTYETWTFLVLHLNRCYPHTRPQS